MKAARTPLYGPPNIIELCDVPTPTPGPDDLLVEVRATPVTAADRRMRSADFPGISALPGRLMMGITRPRAAVQGTAFAGRVVAVGVNVENFQVGDDVFGSVDHGAYAEFVRVPSTGPVARIPRGIAFEDAADVPYGGVTALRFLRDLAQVQAGERVLLLGASGGVGRYAIQIAKHFGAEVIAVASAQNQVAVRSLGADGFVDYRTQAWQEFGPFDVVFDIAGQSTFAQARPHLTRTGRYLTLFVSPSILWHMFLTARSAHTRAMFTVAFGTQADVLQLAKWLDQGVLNASVGPSFSLAHIVDAHQAAGTPSAKTAMVVPTPLAMH